MGKNNMNNINNKIDLSNYVYGKNTIEELLDSNVEVNRVLLQKDLKKSDLDKYIRILKTNNIMFDLVDKQRLDKITLGHQGIIANISEYKYYDLEEVLQNSKDKKNKHIVILDKIEDVHNLGAIIRTAEAAGFIGVVIPKRNAAQVTKIVYKTSAGAVAHIPIIRVSNIKDAVNTCKKYGMWVVGTSLEGSITYNKCDLKGDICIVIGNEEKGISPLVLKNCDFLVKIPMIGKVQSLNASVSAGILIYETIRQNMNI